MDISGIKTMGCAEVKQKVVSGVCYDPLDHLTTVDYPEAHSLTDESYAYDKVGNREDPDNAALYAYNANHQQTQTPTVASMTFDADGNLATKSGGFSYGFNQDNRLTTFTDTGTPANDAEYAYDPFGRRISKTVNGSTTYYVWDENKILAEYNGAGDRIKRYAYLPGGLSPIQVEDANDIYNVHQDHLQTPKFLTDSADQIVWENTMSAFGESTINDDVDGK